ncbi:Lysophospholipase [Rhodovastum atsumiense]|uniref:alpha/beta fold hydrolase n=1 Tax=Rhodovastum atsumiense TaxID=504468 RepID=UPI00193C0A29|nr:alpha/beta fold hydrolase [Rhodovastum atsumiense]CAH2604194.1 Lysophospholipase [Rhodovastum atsumiense]
MRSLARPVVAVAALLAIVLALWHLTAATAGLSITRAAVGPIPVTVFRPAAPGPAPVAVVAHGFAGSQQMMQAFATTLARDGVLVVTFDFPGHGRNPEKLAGGLTDDAAASGALVGALGRVVAFARDLPGGDGRVALVGHSMASDIAIQYARAHPDVDATVAVSVFARDVTADSPRNLQVVVGGLEPEMLHAEGRRIVGMASAGPVREGVTYGRFADGTARRLVVAPGVEHIGVLYSRDTLRAVRDWLDAAFARQGGDFVDARGPWIGLLLLGAVLLAWPLSALLPRAAVPAAGAGLRWRHLLPLAMLPAVATPLLLWKLPTDFLPLLLGDYLAVHCALYGLLTAGGMWLLRRRDAAGEAVRIRRSSLVIAALAVPAYAVLALALPMNAFVSSFLPTPTRVPFVLAMLAGMLPWFLADEWLTRGAAAPRGAYAVTKLCFLLSLALAIALDLHRLFFLIIIVPVILLFFVIYGLFSAWTYAAVRHPLPGALANAIALAWAVGVTFPLVVH